MDELVIPAELWERIDSHLARDDVMGAFLLYREATRCSILVGKEIIGERFRERFPQLWAVHRNLDDDD